MAQVHPRTPTDIATGVSTFGLAAAWVLLLVPIGIAGAVLATGFLHFSRTTSATRRRRSSGPRSCSASASTTINPV